jgi:hypothetical protein
LAGVKWLAGLAAFVMVGFAAYSYVFSAAVRYRLTLEATVNGQPATGSGVVEVTYSKVNDPMTPRELSIDVRGEAVVLDLGSKGALFALLRAGTDNRSRPEYIVLRAFDFPGDLPRPVGEGLKQVRGLSGKRELPLTSLPLLVRFLDSKNMRSAEKVDPLDIGKSFGADAKLVRATLEIVPTGIWPLNYFGFTGEPITTGIAQKLPWWNGPFPWLRPDGGGFVDTRTETFKVDKQDFKRG